MPAAAIPLPKPHAGARSTGVTATTKPSGCVMTYGALTAVPDGPLNWDATALLPGKIAETVASHAVRCASSWVRAVT